MRRSGTGAKVLKVKEAYPRLPVIMLTGFRDLLESSGRDPSEVPPGLFAALANPCRKAYR